MGWVIALIGIGIVFVDSTIGIGIFAIGVLIALASGSDQPLSPQVATVSIMGGMVIGGIVLMVGLAIAVGVLGGLF